MVMVDGKIVALRGRDSRPTTKYIKLNGKELGVKGPNEALFDPPRFYWKSTGETCYFQVISNIFRRLNFLSHLLLFLCCFFPAKLKQNMIRCLFPHL